MSGPVIVVGAGLTGLTVAYELHKAGVEVRVLEAGPTIGGRIRSYTYDDGVVGEAHMEEYWERSPAYPLLRELGVPLVADAAHSSVIIDGALHLYAGEGDRDDYLAGIFSPDEAKAFIRWNQRTWDLYERLHATGLAGRPMPADLRDLMAVSYAEHVREMALPHRVEEWIRVTLEPEIAIEWDQVAALDAIDEMRVFLDSPAGFGERNFHVEGGNSRFAEALAGHLSEDAIQTRAKVTRVIDRPDGVRVGWLDGDGTDRWLDGMFAVVTVPLFAIADIEFEPSLSPERRSAIESTGFGSYVKVVYRVRQEFERLLEQYDDRLFTLLADIPAGTIYNSSVYVPGGDGTRDLLITVLIHGRYANELCQLSDGEIAAMVTANLERLTVRDPALDRGLPLFPGFSSFVTSTRVFAYPTAVAYWPHALGRSRFDDLARNFRRPFGHIVIGGDTTENSHSEGAVVAAKRMTAEVLARLGQVADPTIHQP